MLVSMSVIDEYLDQVSGPEKEVIKHMYQVVRQNVPHATEEMSYAMPAFKYEGKGLVAIMVTKNHLSLYPFCSVNRLGLDLDKYECTSGSIHFTLENPIPDPLLIDILAARRQLIPSKS